MIIPMDAPRREEGEEVNENNQNEVYNLTKWNKYSNANLKSNGGDINDYVVSIPSMNGIEHMYVNARASGVEGIVIDGEVMDDDDEDNAVGQRKSKRNSKAKAKAKMSAKKMSDDSAEEDDDEDDSQLSDSGDNSKKRKRSKSYIPWTVHEDRILLDSQKDMGNNWVEIAKLIPGRSRLDVKSRHRSLMRAFKRIWKPEEDKIILDYHALYKSDWVDRASIAIHRSRNAVRVRFKELVENRISHKGRHSLQHGSPNQVFYDKNSNSNNNNNNNNNNSHNGNIMGLPDHGSSNSNISNWIGNIDKVQVHTIQQGDQDPSQVHVNTCSNSLDHATFAVIPNFHEQSQIIPFQIPLTTQQMIQNSRTAVFLPLDPSQYASLQGIPVVSVPYLPMFNVPVDPNQQNISISNGNANKSNESKSNLARTLTPASSISTLSFPSQTTQVELSQSISNPKSSIVSSANSQKQSQPSSSENAPNLDEEDVNNLLQCLL